jgi:hypothetical protein
MYPKASSGRRSAGVRLEHQNLEPPPGAGLICFDGDQLSVYGRHIDPWYESDWGPKISSFVSTDETGTL